MEMTKRRFFFFFPFLKLIFWDENRSVELVADVMLGWKYCCYVDCLNYCNYSCHYMSLKVLFDYNKALALYLNYQPVSHLVFLSTSQVANCIHVSKCGFFCLVITITHANSFHGSSSSVLPPSPFSSF